jgi:hypothetical protein
VNISFRAGEHFVQGIYVRGDPCDQPADGVFVKEADVQPLQVRKDLRSHVEDRFLSHPLHQVGLRELEQEAQRKSGHVDQRDLGNAIPGRLRRRQDPVQETACTGRLAQIPVDGDHGEVRAKDVHSGFEDDGNERDQRLPPEWPEVAQQPLHQSAVVCFSQYLFFCRHDLKRL